MLFFLTFRYIVAMFVKPDVRLSALKAETEAVLHASVDTEYQICLICMTQRIDKDNKFVVVLECCHAKRAEFRRRFWCRHGYTESVARDKQIDESRDSKEQIFVQSKRVFKIMFFENHVTQQGVQKYLLEFHRKRDNVLSFEVDLGRKTQRINPRLYIYYNDCSNVENEHENNYLTYIDVNISPVQMDKMEKSLIKPSVTKTASSKQDSQKISKVTDETKPENQLSAFEKLQATLASAMKNIDPVDLDTVVTKQIEPEVVKEEDLDFFNTKLDPSNKGMETIRSHS